MKGLNLRDWVKISGDKHTSTLEHKNGHLMTIAHSALTGIQQEQLKRLKMASGGQVGIHESDDDDDDSIAGNSPAGTYARAGSRAKDPDKKKMFNHFAKDEHKKVLGEMKGMRNKDRQYLADGTPDTVQSDDSQPSDDSSPDHSTTININAAPDHSPQGPAPSSMMMQPLPEQPNPMAQAPRYTGQGPSQGTGQIDVPPTPMVPARSDEPNQAIANQYGQSMGQQEKIDSAMGAQRAEIEDSYLKKKQAQQDQDQQNIQQMRSAASRLDSYAQSHPINPKAYFENMGTAQKTSTAIGLLLGGLSGGLNHTGSNPAMAFLQDQQGKDIQAQKDRMEQQKTVFGAYHQLYGDNLIASQLATASHNDMLKHQVDLAAAKLGTAQAAQKANMLNADFDAKNFQLLGAAGQRLSAIKNGQVKPESYGEKPTQSKAPSAPSNQNSNKDYVEGIYTPETFLDKDSERAFKHLSTRALMTPEQKSDVSKQYNNAAQSDSVLKDLPDLFDKLAKTASFSEALGEQAPAISDAAKGTLSGAVGQLVGAAAHGTGYAVAGAQGLLGQGDVVGSNEQYKSYKSKLTKDITSILIRGGMDNESARKAVEANMPGIVDRNRPEALRTKMQTIENLIKQYTPHGTLNTFGYTKIK